MPPSSTPPALPSPVTVVGIRLVGLTGALFAVAAAPVWANHQQVVISRHYENSIGSSDAASQGAIRSELLESRPALRPGEVLEFIPGMVVTQHSGDGKANQYFLRGFNLDHGTDFATTVNGIPVNMGSHAHGQGFSDLNFLMPEMVQRIDYRKGPYFAKGGDFSLAGGADIAYRTRFDRPFADVSWGQRGYRRGVLGGSTALGSGTTALAAVEVMRNDGPWTIPEGLRRHNGVFTLSGGSDTQTWQISAMAYTAQWTATDQIPERAIGSLLVSAPGLPAGRPFGRFDSLDPTTGGRTRRNSLSGQWQQQTADGAVWRAQAYVARYTMDLYSNFTYALERPETGDQFLQRDERWVMGGTVNQARSHALGSLLARTEWGLQWRRDAADVGLFDSAARRITETVRQDTVRQSQTGLYAQTVVEWTPWFRSVTGLRWDHMEAQVVGRSQALNSGSAHANLVSPKLSLIFGPWSKTELFLNAGKGFHSNDARGATIRVDPRSGDPADRVPLLVAGRGGEIGLRTEAIPGLQSSLALWTLSLDSELVYVGDAGATEANAASRRSGVEFSNRYVPAPWILIDADVAWSRGRLTGNQRIPNAVDRVASMAVTLRGLGPYTTSLQWRYLGSGPLVEDNSVRSQPASTLNGRITRALPGLGRHTDLTLDVFNLTNRRVADIQYFYASRLPGEAQPVDGRHLHPAEPRSVRLSLRWGF